MPHLTVMGFMIAALLSRYIRYWYTYRTAVAVLIALGLTGVMYFLYTQQLTCDAGIGKMVQGGVVDEIPIKAFRCLDADGPLDGPCQQPLPNIVLASPDLPQDRDGVVRRIAMAVQPFCFARHTCSTPVMDSFGVATYRIGQFGADFHTAPDVVVADGGSALGTARSTPLDGSGAILINYSGPPGNFKNFGHYVSFSKVLEGSVPADFFQDKIVLMRRVR